MTEIDYVIAQSEQIVRDFEKTKRIKAVTLEEMQAVHTSKQIAGWLTELKILRSLNACDRPQSEWTNEPDDIPKCKTCGYYTPYDRAIDDYEYGNYCPKCGCKMKEGYMNED